jgi:hypothetical protein
MDKRKDRHLEPLCRSCCSKVAKTVTTAYGKCIPWHGDFDKQDNPMLEGELYLPGERLCKCSDCVNRDHIK